MTATVCFTKRARRTRRSSVIMEASVSTYLYDVMVNVTVSETYLMRKTVLGPAPETSSNATTRYSPLVN